MLICDKCGKILSEDFLFAECGCGGEFVVARQCPICDKYYPKEDNPSICRDCMEYEETRENALDIGAENPINLPINGFVAYTLPVELINEILCREAKKRISDSDKSVQAYCEDDEFYFADWIKKKRGVD